MKTADIAVNEAYAYVSGKHSFPQKVFVLATRPTSKRYSGSTYTIGIVRRLGWGKDMPENPDEGNWIVDWVRPAQIVRTWAEQVPLNEQRDRDNDAFVAARDARQKEYTARYEALPGELLDVLDLTPEWKQNALKNGGSTSIYVDMPMLEALAAFVALTTGDSR